MIHAIIVSLLLGATPPMAIDNGPYTVSKSGQNLRPSITFNTQTEQFLITWIHTSDIVKYEEAIVRARLITTQPEVTLGPDISISRPSGSKIYAPFVSARHHPAQSRYVIIWQETLGDARNLMLTTVDNNGEFIRRANRIAVKQGILISPPLIGTMPDQERILIIWNDLLPDGFRSQALTLDTDEPNKENMLFQLAGNHKLVQVPLDIVSRGDGSFTLYGFLLNSSQGVNRYMYRRVIHLDLGPDRNENVVTKRKVRSSMTLDAEGSEENDLILYNLNIPKKGLNSLSVFPSELDAGGIARPGVDTNPSATAFEGTLLAPASVDGMAKIIWVEENEGIHSLMMQHVDAEGEFVGEPMIIRQVNSPISFPTAAWGAAQTEAMVAWCENMSDGTVQLMMTIVDLSEMPQ